LKIHFPYPGVPSLEIPDSAKISWLEPKTSPPQMCTEINIIRKGLVNPIGAPRLKEAVRGKKKVLILIDDHTRNTPVNFILPEVFAELKDAGVEQKNIRIMVASGTHRAMTFDEKVKKVGQEVVENYTILDHHFDDPNHLVSLPSTPGGTEVWINRALLESDFVIGIGHIVPHRVAGFSGGGKIVLPGVSGSKSTGQTHWLSAQYSGSEIIGKVNNPVRHEIEAAARMAGLSYIVNAVLDGKGSLVDCFCGDSIEAFQAGACLSLDIFSAPLSEPADIVIADSNPANIDMWQASKAIYASDLALQQGGILILVTPCPEGVSSEFPQIMEIGYRPFSEINDLVDQGVITDLTLAAHLVHVGKVIREKSTAILVSRGIDSEMATRIGFEWAATPQDAFNLALERKGKMASIAVLRNGGEIMPLLESR
jgi:nickel-dependent lactate racemase